jgi:myosin heavy subunit
MLQSRVVYQTPGERSFHIFYDLLAGASEAERNEWQLYPPEQFHYLNQSGCYYVDDVDDAQEFAVRLLRAERVGVGVGVSVSE